MVDNKTPQISVQKITLRIFMGACFILMCIACNSSSDNDETEHESDTPEVTHELTLEPSESSLKAEWLDSEDVTYNLIYGQDEDILTDPANYATYDGSMDQDVSSPHEIKGLEKESTYHVVLEVDDERGTRYPAKESTTLNSEKILSSSDVLWIFEKHDGVVRSLAAYDSTVYSSGNDETVRAIDAKSGDEIWVFEEHFDFIYSVENYEGTVYSAARGGASSIKDGYDSTVRAIDSGTGEEKWVFDGNRSFYDVAAADNSVYAAKSSGSVLQIDAEKGSRKQVIGQHDRQARGVAVAGGTVFSAGHDTTIRAFDVEQEEEKWVYEGPESPHKNFLSVAATKEAVYAGSDTSIRALDADTGEKQWAYEDIQSGGFYTVKELGDVVYGGSLDGKVRAIDSKTGEKKWVFAEHEDHVRAVVPTEHAIYSGDSGGTILAIDPP
ncbi:WD40 repeat domain-containing protein [Halorhodospira halophila]|nr:PQQ-binding-like beta-propeller repeat protein [Halorhodospira halophila]